MRFRAARQSQQSIQQCREVAPDSRRSGLFSGTAPITVLYVIDQLSGMGGAERALLKIVCNLPQAYVRPIVATFRYSATLLGGDPFPVPLHVLPLRRTYDWTALDAAYKLRRIIRRENVGIVHTFFETSDLWGGIIAKLSGCPLLVSSRRDMGILRNWKHHLAYRVLGGMFDQIQTVSEQVREITIRQDQLAPERVVTVYSGVDVQSTVAAMPHSDICSRLAVPSSSRFVITVANVRRIKAIDVLIRAAHLVCKTDPNIVFIIVGDIAEQSYYEELASLIEALELSGRVLFWGSEPRVAKLLPNAEIFALLSHTEGFSNALIEAMACGLPCVATDIGGNSEAIRSGENGYLVPRGDHVAAAKCIDDLLHNGDERRRTGNAAAQTIGAQFTTGAMIDRLMYCYGTLFH